MRETFFSIAFSGLAFAMVLYIISVGLSITMGLLGVANLAHGAFAAAGGYTAYYVTNRMGVPFFPALLLASVFIAAVSVVLERLLYARVYAAGELEQVLLSMGLIFMTVATLHFFFGPHSYTVEPPAALRGQIDIAGRILPTYRVFLIALGLITFVGLGFIIERTNLGACIRAAVDNRAMAEAIGVNTRRLFTIVFALGSGLAALGGAAGAEVIELSPGYALNYLVYFLIVVAVGGLGTVTGPFFAALLLGVSDSACKILVPEFGAFFIYVAVFVVLLLRPAGLFGRS
ncbi:branched-chain amino acid ABC transporter permease [Pseudorhodoplanes sp.]|uniref:branched-chain amino acid ABC transporter permease n=1 Tax=Pseudorhodoplanes sp. TaxID=1934341 RepID=UPI003D0E9FB3